LPTKLYKFEAILEEKGKLDFQMFCYAYTKNAYFTDFAGNLGKPNFIQLELSIQPLGCSKHFFWFLLEFYP